MAIKADTDAGWNTRQPNGDWLFHEQKEMTADFELKSLGISVAISELYRGVKFDPVIPANMGVVWNLCSHTVVMRCGEVVEQGETKALFAAPQTAYTRQLLDALPERATPRQPIRVAA